MTVRWAAGTQDPSLNATRPSGRALGTQDPSLTPARLWPSFGDLSPLPAQQWLASGQCMPWGHLGLCGGLSPQQGQGEGLRPHSASWAHPALTSPRTVSPSHPPWHVLHSPREPHWGPAPGHPGPGSVGGRIPLPTRRLTPSQKWGRGLPPEPASRSWAGGGGRRHSGREGGRACEPGAGLAVTAGESGLSRRRRLPVTE